MGDKGGRDLCKIGLNFSSSIYILIFFFCFIIRGIFILESGRIKNWLERLKCWDKRMVKGILYRIIDCFKD